MDNKKNTDPSEGQAVTWHAPKWNEHGKCYWDAQTQHESLNARANLILPPTKAIPVIFLPGVMGSNLMSTDGNHSKIWNGDDLIDTFLEWRRKNGETRRTLLNPDSTVVDNSGKVSQEIHSLITDDGKLFPTRKQRGWGEVLFFSYGKFLSVFQGALLDNWQRQIQTSVSDTPGETQHAALTHLVGQRLKTEESKESVLSEAELQHFTSFLFPVHVFGYNWLEDNAVSAERLGKYIDEVIVTYRHKHGGGMAFPEGKEKVILVTHSMGGLVARHASQVLGYQDKILGIVHGVIPDQGSPAAYRRMKVGAAQEGAAGLVMGKTAKELMPVLARAPAPLQLLPSARYFNGSPWLTVQSGDTDNRDLKLPKNQDPFGEIYLNKTLWWRLYESDIIDKDELISESNWKEYSTSIVDIVKPFILDLEYKYHPNTYAFYGKSIPSDGTLTWKKTFITYPKNMHEGEKRLPNNYQEVPLPYNRSRYYKLTSSETPGDGTVPQESLYAIRNFPEIKSVLATKVDHQGAYNVDSLIDIQKRPALQFTLRAIIKMVQEVQCSC